MSSSAICNDINTFTKNIFSLQHMYISFHYEKQMFGFEGGPAVQLSTLLESLLI